MQPTTYSLKEYRLRSFLYLQNIDRRKRYKKIHLKFESTESTVLFLLVFKIELATVMHKRKNIITNFFIY
jgi:hypothetical protein